MKCPLCGARETEVLLDGADLLHKVPGRFCVERCQRCRFVFTNPRPDADSMAKFYPDDYTAYQKKDLKEKGWRTDVRRALLREFCGYPGKRKWHKRAMLWPLYRTWRSSGKSLFWPEWEGKGRLLDVGCGAGRFLWKMAQEHWSVKGIDMSHAAAMTAREWYGIEVAVGTYPHEHFPDASFDVITMWNSLEHFAEPVRALSSAGKVLADGGRLLVSVPNFASYGAKLFCDKWFPLDIPRHLNHFTLETLEKTLSKGGFRLEWTRPLRRNSSLRRSARYAIAAGDRRPLTLLLATRAGAGVVGRTIRTAKDCDLVVGSARKVHIGKESPQVNGEHP